MSVETTKEYSNGEVTVVWNPRKCFHAANCVHMLPEVYKPTEKPWIQIDNGSTEALKAQVKTCPSGALTYFMNDGSLDRTGAENSTLEVLENGPLVIYGEIEVQDKDGTTIPKSTKTAFCRCGGSSKKPFCDGSHLKNGFEG